MTDSAGGQGDEHGGQIVSLARARERGRQSHSLWLQRSLQSGAPLLGRQDELALVFELLADPSVRLVSLTGRSGVGKTRLALEVAWALDSRQRGSVRMVSLAGVSDPGLVYAEMASQLQVPRLPGVPLAAALIRSLARSPLVVVDNFEHLLGAASLLNDLLDACEELQLLVTSQSPLRLRAERTVSVAPLPLPEDNLLSLADLLQQPAIALYCDRARAVSHRFQLNPGNAGAVVAVCRQLEGLPLAIELAAARATTFSAADLLIRLSGRRLDVLRSARADAPGRHQDLRSAIDWTYQLLSPAEQELLRRLSVVGVWFDVDDIEALAESESTQVLDDLSALVDLHLVEVTPDDGAARFELLPSIRDFARDELIASGHLEDVERVWTAWMAGRARSAARELTMGAPDEGRAWLEGAQDRLMHTLGVCLSRRQVDEALDVFNALAPIWANGPIEPAHRQLIERTIQLAEEDNRKVGSLSEAWAWSALLQVFVLERDRHEVFLRRLRRAEELARHNGDDIRLLHALSCRIAAAAMTGEQAWARTAIAEGLDLSARMGATAWLARFEELQARLYDAAGDDEHALVAALSSLDHARQISDTVTALRAAQLLQTLAPRHSQAAAALPPPVDLIEMARATHQTIMEAVLAPTLALQAAATGDTATAARWCRRGLELSGPDPSSYLAGFVVFAAVEIVAIRGDLELAARLHGRLGDVAERLNVGLSPPFITAHAGAIARLRHELGAERFETLVAEGSALPWESTFRELGGYLRDIESPELNDLETDDTGRSGGLTDRQLEVVRLLARGLSNKEIARALGVAPKTVMHHTVAIYKKLELRGRTEVVAWAMKSGLT